jgi:hypothetical protein
MYVLACKSQAGSRKTELKLRLKNEFCFESHGIGFGEMHMFITNSPSLIQYLVNFVVKIDYQICSLAFRVHTESADDLAEGFFHNDS